MAHIQSREPVFDPSVRESTPFSLHNDFSVQSFESYDYSSQAYVKPHFTATPSTSDSIGTTFSSSESSEIYGSQRVWSSAESFPSIGSNIPSSAEQLRALNSQFNRVKQQNIVLLKDNRILGAKLDALMKAYELLVNRLPQLSAAAITQPESREMNPNVKFWTRQEWTAANSDRISDLDGGANPGARGRSRAAKGINVNMKYIEDRQGQPVSGYLASDIRRHAQAIFVGLAHKGNIFSSWTEADHDSLKLYYREMADRFEELCLCANDWKSEMIALDIYRTWQDQYRKKLNKKVSQDNKNKPGDDSTGESDNEGSQQATKKMKRSIESEPPPAFSGHVILTPVNTQPLQMHATLTINVVPGTPARPDAGVMVTNDPRLLQPGTNPLLQPALPRQLSFDIVNPLHTSNTHSSQSALNIPAFGAINPGAAPNKDDSQLIPANKPRRMRPTKSTTARNLCAIDWCKENKGSADEFNKFWNDLPKEEKEKYGALSKEHSEQEKMDI